MIPITQDQFGEEGNCMAACVASILELSLDQVPNFAAGNNSSGAWFPKMWDFLYPRGFEIVPYYLSGRVNPDDTPLPDEVLNFLDLPEHLLKVHPYYLQCGPAARGFSHATVGRGGLIVHDPHPSRAGLIKTDHYLFLCPLSKE
jgi:hypothetical protein